MIISHSSGYQHKGKTYLLKGFQSYKDGSFRIIALNPKNKVVSKKLDAKDLMNFHKYNRQDKERLLKKYFK